MKEALKLACVVLLLGLTTQSLWAQDEVYVKPVPKPANTPKPVLPAPVPVPTANAPADNAPPDYVIGADDTLHISVWKEPDLTATLPVRPDGKISLRRSHAQLGASGFIIDQHQNAVRHDLSRGCRRYARGRKSPRLHIGIGFVELDRTEIAARQAHAPAVLQIDRGK